MSGGWSRFVLLAQILTAAWIKLAYSFIYVNRSPNIVQKIEEIPKFLLFEFVEN